MFPAERRRLIMHMQNQAESAFRIQLTEDRL